MNNMNTQALEQLAALAAAGEAARNTEGPAGLNENNLTLLSRLQQQFPQRQHQQQQQQQQQAPQPVPQQTQQTGADSATALLALQSYYNMLVQSQANNSVQSSSSSSNNNTTMHGGSGALAAALAGLTGVSQPTNAAALAGLAGVSQSPIYQAQLTTQQVPQVMTNSVSSTAMPFQNNNTNPSVASSTEVISQPASSNTTASLKLAPKVGSGGGGGGGAVVTEHDNDEFEGFNADGKKQMKRAANRRSAQLSRKRKKQFIEELKDENDELRRKEQILRSLPDLIVVFDSGGKLWFVSHSVERFLRFTAAELEGASFWDRLCEDSVRLLKAAFMDSLAARRPEMDTAPLGSGVWELRLVDKDGCQKLVTLNGVVHFAGERPECVCSIRPVDDETESSDEDAVNMASTTVSFADKPLRKIRPQQTVIRPIDKQRADKSSSNKKAKRSSAKGRIAVRISDSGNSSVESESGSSDDNMASSS